MASLKEIFDSLLSCMRRNFKNVSDILATVFKIFKTLQKKITKAIVMQQNFLMFGCDFSGNDCLRNYDNFDVNNRTVDRSEKPTPRDRMRACSKYGLPKFFLDAVQVREDFCYFFHLQLGQYTSNGVWLTSDISRQNLGIVVL